MKILLLFIILISFTCGCATTGIYSDTGYGFLFNSQTEPGALGVDRGSLKTGESCCHNILGIVVSGDCSVKASKRNGNLNSVSFYDKNFFSVLSIYGKVCTITHGK